MGDDGVEGEAGIGVGRRPCVSPRVVSREETPLRPMGCQRDHVDVERPAREEHREAVLAEFRKQLSRDRVKTMTGGFSQLGLVELTRKRTRESLAHMLCEPCPSCQGKGIVKTARSVAYDIFREILREARQFNPQEFRVVAAPQVVDLLLDEESQHLAGLSEFIGKPVSLQAEGAMGQEQYDIVLL